jgi:hypothetical protein
MPVPDHLQTSHPPVARATGRWPIVVSLLALAAPMLLGQAGQVLLQLTDTLLIGHVGAVELAAASLAGNFVMFALYFAYGAVGAVSPTIAQLHGAGDRDGVSRMAEAGAWLALMIGGVIAVSLSGVVPLLEYLGQPPDVARAAWAYLLLIAWSMPGAIPRMVSRFWPCGIPRTRPSGGRLGDVRGPLGACGGVGRVDALRPPRDGPTECRQWRAAAGSVGDPGHRPPLPPGAAAGGAGCS